jgi:hypothetical protein
VKAWLPPLGSRWELTEDWTLPRSAVTRYDNMDFVKNFGLLSFAEWPEYVNNRGNWLWDDTKRARYDEWQEEMQLKARAIFPAGTSIQFNRYHVSNSGEDLITMEIVRSPDKRLMIKKRGGTGKGKMRFYTSLAELNTFPELKEYEEDE